MTGRARYRLWLAAACSALLLAACASWLAVRGRMKIGPEPPPCPLQPWSEDSRHGIADRTLDSEDTLVQGRTLDPTGAPIVGAEVALHTFPDDRVGEPVLTDVHGRFSLPVPLGRAFILAQAKGYAAGEIGTPTPSSGLEIVLIPESRLSGRVHEADTDVPLADITVEVVSFSSLRFARGRRVSAITDSTGAFTLTGLEPGRYKPRAEGSGWYGEARESVRLGLREEAGGLLIEVRRASEVSGRVVLESTGEPCVDTVLLAHRGIRLSYERRSDLSGEVRFPAILPGTYDVWASCGGSRMHELASVVVADADVRELEWTVPESASIAGSVVDHHGRPASNVQIRALLREAFSTPRDSLALEQVTAASKSDGAFVFGDLVPGKYHVWAGATGKRIPPPNAVEVVVRASQQHADLRLTVDTPGVIQGSVIDVDGHPLHAFSIQLKSREPRRGFGTRHSIVDTHGEFMVTGLPPGEYFIGVSTGAAGYLALTEEVTMCRVAVLPGEAASVSLRVESMGHRITGRVLDASGAVVPNVFVAAARDWIGLEPHHARIPGTLFLDGPLDTILSGDNGRFVLDGLARGSYTVRAHDAAGNEALVEGVQTGSESTLRFVESVTLSGSVSLPRKGAPRFFSLLLPGAGIARYQREERFVDTDGQWILRDIPPGSYELAAFATEGTATHAIEVDPESSGDDIALDLTPRATLRAQVIDLETREGLGGLEISATWGGVGWIKRTVTDASGRFELADIPAGRLDLHVHGVRLRPPSYLWPWRILVQLVPGRVNELPPIKVVPNPHDRYPPYVVGISWVRPPAGESPEEWRIVVEKVSLRSPAASTDLRAGDVITTVNGVSVVGFEQYLFYPLMRAGAGKPIRLTLADGRAVIIRD